MEEGRGRSLADSGWQHGLPSVESTCSATAAVRAVLLEQNKLSLGFVWCLSRVVLHHVGFVLFKTCLIAYSILLGIN